MQDTYIKSPFNYSGGKYRLLNQLIPLFPKDINKFIDLFAGACNVGINVKSKYTICNDNLKFLIDVYNYFKANTEKDILDEINDTINFYGLSKTNREGYSRLRDEYNREKKPLNLFILCCFAFNNQIRFNSLHEFNSSFGINKSYFNSNIQNNLILFLSRIKNIDFLCFNFEDFNFSELKENDFVYADPPYLISTGVYNDGKRGFTGWSEKEEIKLLSILDTLNKSKVKFALSNVLTHKGKENKILKDWIDVNKYLVVNQIKSNYSSCSYNTKKGDSQEVLICNYDLFQSHLLQG